MCQPKPGARCFVHAFADYKQAQEAMKYYDRLGTGVGLTPAEQKRFDQYSLHPDALRPEERKDFNRLSRLGGGYYPLNAKEESDREKSFASLKENRNAIILVTSLTGAEKSANLNEAHQKILNTVVLSSAVKDTLTSQEVGILNRATAPLASPQRRLLNEEENALAKKLFALNPQAFATRVTYKKGNGQVAALTPAVYEQWETQAEFHALLSSPEYTAPDSGGASRAQQIRTLAEQKYPGLAKRSVSWETSQKNVKYVVSPPLGAFVPELPQHLQNGRTQPST